MPLNYQQLKGRKFPERQISYTSRDTILYALGIGFGENPTDPSHLRYLLEDRLLAFPTFAAVVGTGEAWLTQGETGITLSHVVHGEQSLQMHAPLPGEGTLIVDGQVKEVVDKGKAKGAIVYVDRTVRCATSRDLIASATMGIFCRADGGFDGPVTQGPAPHAIPTRPFEAAVDLNVAPRSALIYRLSGDTNMLHVDPDFAKAAGFPAPILHGMCTYAMAGRAVIQQYGEGSPAVLRSLQARFTAPVFTGETLRTEFWRDGAVVSFRVRVLERDVIVLNHGRAELN